MFEEVLSADAIKAVKSLAPRVGDFYLAGGTALALQLRHRKSDDLDFFSTRPFNTDVLLATIQATRVFFTSQGTIHCEVEGIRVSFLYYEVPLIAAPAVWRGIKVAHWRDIGAEKIKTISQRGAKKDFCDLYAIIKLRASIREVCS
ncbi:MAG: nucleotidyl transferase AbiEii/AbiGii toxin family protein, partial [Deltaproteobacteria bacterium]|nr:nucleotidyl transferase AbiEii/AbiGii toxin family protein [Deltaproteobacteria bacterium]